ncbi:MAG: ABC transporter permease [Roseinatronobacter sp.]
MRGVRLDIQMIGLVVINVVILLLAYQLVGPRFLSPFNLQSMAGQVPEIGLLALGVTLAMIAGRGGIDLSGIALANLSGICAFLILGPANASGLAGSGYLLAFMALSVAFGLAGGVVNGVIIGYLGVTSIIATLGTQLLFTGIAVAITGGSAQTLGFVPVLDDFANEPVYGMPLTVWLFLAVALAVAGWLRFTISGQHLFLMGSNFKAARYAGIPSRSLLLKVYMISGALAGVAGVIIAARTSSMKWDYGSSYVLVAILIAVMAGVRPEGGHGRVICVVLAACALQLLSSFFNFMALSNFLRDFAWGTLLLVFLAVMRVDLSGYWRLWRDPESASASAGSR